MKRLLFAKMFKIQALHKANYLQCNSCVLQCNRLCMFMTACPWKELLWIKKKFLYKLQCCTVTWAKGLSSKVHDSPWGHLRQAEWWCILGPAWRTAHNPPSQCHRTITRGLQQPVTPSRPPLPHEANHVIWCNDRVMTQIGGVLSFPLLEAPEEVVNTWDCLSSSKSHRYHITQQVTEDIQVLSQVKSRLMVLLWDSFMSLSNYISLNEGH